MRKNLSLHLTYECDKWLEVNVMSSTYAIFSLFIFIYFQTQYDQIRVEFKLHISTNLIETYW